MDFRIPSSGSKILGKMAVKMKMRQSEAEDCPTFQPNLYCEKLMKLICVWLGERWCEGSGY